MTAALLDDPQIKSRASEFRRENARREFFGPLAEDGPVDCGLQIAELPVPGSEFRVPGSELAPGETDKAKPETRNSEPDAPSTDNAENAAAAADAKNLLASARVQAWLQGKSPSKRNRDVFRAVVVEHRPQREVAAAYGISQPRVSQILNQVASWLSHMTVERDQARPPEEQLRLAENVTRMQYEHLYGLALDLLLAPLKEAAGETEQADRNGQGDASHHPARPTQPKVGFLNAALRAVGDRAKFEGIVGLPAKRVPIAECTVGTGVGEGESGRVGDRTSPPRPLSPS